ncbi:hypothetical protein EXU30_04295 [Shewanella maritima]|uniref:Uncharacterized protein n=1 Tax=Shewanella maritima TaxID=2520507 RepID=A0A411PEK0_9GAMM|nr:hypothetical protein [Shewanella maritima]QBF82007.1 hypothetical protein EXU30_04295 [Shewanella maritima]
MAVETVAEIFTGVFRFLFRILNEVLLEFLLKGTGYFICRPFSKNINPDGFVVIIAGLVFWGSMFIVAIKVYGFIQVDICLDAGGRYNYQTKTCLHQN